MWKSIHSFGLSNEEIDSITNELIKKEKETLIDSCPDCGMEIGEQHLEGCDVARCSICGGQRLSCNCKSGDGGEWTGTWPGTLEALELGLVCCWEDTKEWQADLNELSRRRYLQ